MRPIIKQLGFVALLLGASFATSQAMSDITLPSWELMQKSQPVQPNMSVTNITSLPDISRTKAWIRPNGINPSRLEGKYVVLYFWNRDCVSCLELAPGVTSLMRGYSGQNVVVASVHTPLDISQTNTEELQKTSDTFRLLTPIFNDKDYVVWEQFSPKFWPAFYLFDPEGSLVQNGYGKQGYVATESYLLETIGEPSVASTNVLEAPAPEDDELNTFFGWKRNHRFSGTIALRNRSTARMYVFPDVTPLNQWSLNGQWLVEKTFAELLQGEGQFRYTFDAPFAHMVFRTQNNKATKIYVTLDGEPVPEAMRGDDVLNDSEGNTFILAEFQKIYKIVENTTQMHTLELQVDTPGVRVYSIILE